MDSKTRKLDAIKRARNIFRQSGGLLRMSDAIRRGIHRSTLAILVQRGEVHRISRGLYQLENGPPLIHPDLAIVAAKVPKGVICLISALAFHELTTQIPHEVHLAIDRNAEAPRLEYPPLRSYRFGGDAFSAGVELHSLGQVKVRVYSREKTLADCFKYRNQIGLDICLEALRVYRSQRGYAVDKLLHCAKICRVTNVIRPYLEVIQ